MDGPQKLPFFPFPGAPMDRVKKLATPKKLKRAEGGVFAPASQP
jgi:hypothetical protein